LTPARGGRIRAGRFEIIADGHAAGLMAVDRAVQGIRSGQFSICLAGGIETYLLSKVLLRLEQRDQLHGGSNTWGFIPGEAAGFCLLASASAADRLGVEKLGEILATAHDQEKNVIGSQTVCLGEGLSKAVRRALDAIPDRGLKIDQIYCDMNGEPYRADEFGFTMQRVSRRLVSADQFFTPADCWGDVGAASGPLSLVLAIVAGRKGYSLGPMTLILTSSEGGARAVAVARVPEPGGKM